MTKPGEVPALKGSRECLAEAPVPADSPVGAGGGTFVAGVSDREDGDGVTVQEMLDFINYQSREMRDFIHSAREG